MCILKIFGLKSLVVKSSLVKITLGISAILVLSIQKVMRLHSSEWEKQENGIRLMYPLA